MEFGLKIELKSMSLTELREADQSSEQRRILSRVQKREREKNKENHSVTFAI